MRTRGQGHSRFTLAVLVVISITVLAVDLLGVGPLGALRDVVDGVLSPVRAVGHALFGPDDSDEVEALRRRVDELEGAEAQLANVEAELARLREQLNLQPPQDVAAIAANVTSGPASNFDLTIQIDKGSRDGVEVDMPVATRAGLVGVVDQVSFNSARIRLITDPDLQVGVKHSASGDLGIAHGQGEGEPLIIDRGFDVSTLVTEGDVFVTSGVRGSHFPGDIPVGRAVARSNADNPLEQRVEIEPLADLDRLTQVAVYLFTPASAG